MSARIQTWFPFNLQICLNGRHWLMQQLNLLTTALFAARDASIKQLLTQAA